MLKRVPSAAAAASPPPACKAARRVIRELDDLDIAKLSFDDSRQSSIELHRCGVRADGTNRAGGCLQSTIDRLPEVLPGSKSTLHLAQGEELDGRSVYG